MDLKEFKKYIPAHWAKTYSAPHWTAVIVLPKELSETEIFCWCLDNCTDRFDVYNGGSVIFESMEDAAGFKLRWL